MNRISGAVLLLLLTGIVGLRAQLIESPYEVGKWYGFKDCAITYTFDDWTANQYATAVPVLNGFGFSATFYIVISWGPDWNNVLNTAKMGHEIASHSLMHPRLNELTVEEEEKELGNSARKIIEETGAGNGLTIAYPYCVPGRDSLVSKYYFGARHCQGYVENSTPADIFRVSAIICGSQGQVHSSADFIAKHNEAYSKNGWSVYLMHGIDDDGGYSSLLSDTLRKSLEYLEENPEKFWVDNFGNVIRYIRERNSVSLHDAGSDADTVRVRVSDNLDDLIFNHPLTIRFPLPENWQQVSGIQNRVPVKAIIISDNKGKFVQFDAVPDRGVVSLFNGGFLPE